MNISRASMSDFGVVKKIVHTTIKNIYPHYYPHGVVDFFLHHHSDENIQKAIAAEDVLLLDDRDVIVGTGTARKNEITRLFILPQFQRAGYGTALMDELEGIIRKDYTEIILDSSLPAYDLYLKRGYFPMRYEKIITPNKDVLCFHVLKKIL